MQIRQSKEHPPHPSSGVKCPHGRYTHHDSCHCKPSGPKEFNNVLFLNNQPPPAQLWQADVTGTGKALDAKTGAVVSVSPHGCPVQLIDVLPTGEDLGLRIANPARVCIFS